MPPDFLPTASLEILRLRANVFARIRNFFDTRGYLEVDTPLMSHDQVIDANLEPLIVSTAHHGTDLYLQTSPEFAMKRLLVAGLGSIYQLGKVFRRAERGQRHNPEFTMVEWYGVHTDLLQQMTLTEELVRAVALNEPGVSLSDVPFRRTSYIEAFDKYLGIDVFRCSNSDLEQVARKMHVDIPAGQVRDDRDGWLHLLISSLIEPQLGQEAPEFLYDYPASQAALAQVKTRRRTSTICSVNGQESNPRETDLEYQVAERFELYIRGLELCNGYHELTDPEELRERIRREWTTRDGAPPVSSRLLKAMEFGLPPCSGVALGVDRLIMIVAGKQSIDDVIPFPIERC